MAEKTATQLMADYEAACKRLLEKALFTGDGQMLKDVKIAMDQVSVLCDELKPRTKLTKLVAEMFKGGNLGTWNMPAPLLNRAMSLLKEIKRRMA